MTLKKNIYFMFLATILLSSFSLPYLDEASAQILPLPPLPPLPEPIPLPLPINNPPTASNDSATTNENTPVKINVLKNDSDPDGDALSVTSTSTPTNGAAVINSDNTITYSPNSGFSGTDSFTYRISDGNGGYDAATITVTVFAAPENTPPTASNDSATTNENTPVRINVLANDSDADGDTLSVVSASAPSNGAAQINSDNTITYSPNSGFSGTDTFSYTVSDGNGGSDAAAVTVTTFATPPPPPPTATLTVESANLSGTIFEGMWIELFQNGQIIDSGLTPFSASVDSGAQYEVVANNFEDIVFDHWDDGSTNPTRAFSISQDATFTAFYQTDTAPQNNPPVAADDSATTNEDVPVTVSVLANDSDPDGDTLSVTSTSTPSDGTASINADNTITYSPNQGFSGTDTFSYTISDSNGGSDTATVTVTVSDTSQPNNPPVAADDSTTTNEDTPVTVDVLANDSDPDGDTISIDSFDAAIPSGATITRDDNGTPQDQSDDRLVYTPPENAFGTDTFSYTISDGNGGSDAATVTVTVTTVNDPPTANNDSAQADMNASVTINVLANDIDVEGNQLSVTSTSTPTSGTASINADNTITYTPNQSFVGTDSFTYAISDSNGGSDTATVTVTVSDPAANNPPTANNDSAQTQVNTPVTINVLANDSDPDGNTISLASFDAAIPSGATITRDDNGTPQDQSDDNLVYTPPSGSWGSDTFSYTISDGNGGSDSATVTVVVEAPSNP